MSLALCGGWNLAASREEEKEIGEALADCLDTLPTPVGEAVSKGGPWLKLGSRLGGAVMTRMALFRTAQVEAAEARKNPSGLYGVPSQPPPPPGATGPIAGAPVVEAPDPARAGTGASPWGAGDVMAPEPINVGR